MENFAESLLQVAIKQGSLKQNYDHKVRTRMKRNLRMKLFSLKIRVWIGQWNVRTLHKAGKVAQLAAEMQTKLRIFNMEDPKYPLAKGHFK